MGLATGIKYQLNGKTQTRIILSQTGLEGYIFKNSLILTGPGADNNLKIFYTFKQDSSGVYVDDFRADCN